MLTFLDNPEFPGCGTNPRNLLDKINLWVFTLVFFQSKEFFLILNFIQFWWHPFCFCCCCFSVSSTTDGGFTLYLMEDYVSLPTSTICVSGEGWVDNRGRAWGITKRQSLYFKCRIPWHIAVAFRRGTDSQMEMMTFVHIFDSCNQVSRTVLASLNDVFHRLKGVMPQLQWLYLRQDNAGCYHCSLSIVTARQVAEVNGLRLAMMDFPMHKEGKVLAIGKRRQWNLTLQSILIQGTILKQHHRCWRQSTLSMMSQGYKRWSVVHQRLL